MGETDRHWIGTGDTPREAIRDIAPDQDDRDDVAWVEGIRGRLRTDSPAEYENPIRHTITVIYEERPPEEWLLKATYEDNEWQATFIGSKKM